MTPPLQVAGLGPVTIAVRASDEEHECLRDELEPFIAYRAEVPRVAPLLELELRGDAGPSSWRDVTEGAQVAVDTSLYAELASDGLRFAVDGGYVVRIASTATHVFFDGTTSRAVVHQPDPSLLVRDGVRTVKSLVTVGVELLGGVQVHAAGVTLEDGRAVLVLGDMWHGKTTLLLELLAGFSVGQLSCDTTVILPDGDSGVTAYGWPSPFSVSHGTLSDHPELASFFPEERQGVRYDELWREGKKAILTSEAVVRTFGTRITPFASEVAHCIVARFAPDEPTGLTPIATAAELGSLLRRVYLGSRDPIYHNWHGYFVAEDEAIEGNIERMSERLIATCPVTLLTWAPSAVSLLKRIPELGRMHNHLGRLLTSF